MTYKVPRTSAMLILCLLGMGVHGEDKTPSVKPDGLKFEHPDCTKVQFSPDGRVLVTSAIRQARGPKGGFAKIIVWDAATGKMLGEPISHPLARFTGAYFHGPWISDDSKYLLTYRPVGPNPEANQVTIWELPDVKPLSDTLKFSGSQHGFIGLNSSGQIVTVSPDFARRDKATRTSEIQLWDLATRKAVGTPNNMKFLVGGIAFNKGNKQVFLNGEGFFSQSSKTVRVFDLETRNFVGDPWPTGSVRQLLVDADAKIALTRSVEQHGLDAPKIPDVRRGDSWEVIRRWEIASGKHVGQPIHVRKTPPIQTGTEDDLVALATDGRTVAVVQEANTVQVIDMETGKPVGPQLKHDEAVYRMLFSADGKRLWTASAAPGRSGGCWLWDVGSGKRIANIPEEGKIINIALHPNNMVGCTLNDKGGVTLWNLRMIE